MEKISTSKFVEAVANYLDEPKGKVQETLNAIKTQLICATASGRAVEIYGLGIFKPVQRKERTVNTPMMSGAKTVPAKTALAFKASKAVQL